MKTKKLSKEQKLNEMRVDLQKDYEARCILFCEEFERKYQLFTKQLNNEISNTFDLIHRFADEIGIENKKDILHKIHSISETEKAKNEIKKFALIQAHMACEDKSIYYNEEIRAKFLEIKSRKHVSRNNALLAMHKPIFKDQQHVFAQMFSAFQFALEKLK